MNWFRRGEDGHFLWPGYGENSRVLKWIFEFCDGTAKTRETELGIMPAEGAIDLEGITVSEEDQKALFTVDKEGWKKAMPEFEAHYAKFGSHLPKELREQLDILEKNVGYK